MTGDGPSAPVETGGSARLLVAVSGSGRGAQVVESAAALATGLGLSWHALFVETPRSARDPSIARRAADALARAAQLGATVSAEAASSVAEGLIAHLEASPADHLVIGSPSALRSRPILAASFLREFMAHKPELTIHLAPAVALSSIPSEKPLATAVPWRDHLVAVGAVAVTLGICALLARVTGGRTLNLLFLFPVIAVAARFGVGPALTAVVAAVLSFDLFLLKPLFHLEPLAPVNIVLWVALGTVAAYTSFITGALRSRVTLSDRSAQESARVATFAQTLGRVATWDETAQAVCDEVAEVMNAHVIVFRERDGRLVRAAARPADPSWGPVDQAALDWAWEHGEEAGAGTTDVSAADWRLRPLKTSLGMLAVVALSRNDGRDPVRADRAVLFATLMSQAALAHERLVLEDNLVRRSDRALSGSDDGDATDGRRKMS